MVKPRAALEKLLRRPAGDYVPEPAGSLVFYEHGMISLPKGGLGCALTGQLPSDVKAVVDDFESCMLKEPIDFADSLDRIADIELYPDPALVNQVAFAASIM